MLGHVYMIIIRRTTSRRNRGFMVLNKELLSYLQDLKIIAETGRRGQNQ